MRIAIVLIAILAVIWFTAQDSTVKCSLGLTSCISSQDSKIPSDDVIKILDHCRTFTDRNIGYLMLQTSGAEIFKQANGQSTPLTVALMDFEFLHDSPLKFTRKSRVDDSTYPEIKRSCVQLQIDFYDNSKWSK